MITGIKDVDREILGKVDDNDLRKVWLINKKIYYEVCDDNFLKRRLSKYSDIEKYKEENWKQFFLKINFYISKLKEFDFDYISGDFKKQYSLLKKTDNMNDLLFNACEEGELNVVIYALKNGAGMRDYALKIASQSGHVEIVKYFVENGFDIHANNESALFFAADNGHYEVVKYLVEKGADIHISEEEPFRWASRNGHYEVVKYLLEKGADVHIQGNYALKWATQYNHTKIIEYLESFD